MKFLCLGYLNAAEFDALGNEKVGEIMQGCMTHLTAYRGTGKILAEAGVTAAPTARSMRRKNGRLVVTDGPFLESKEVLGSFFIVEAETVEEAVKIAALHPAAAMPEGEPYGWGIEVWPLQHDPFA